MSLSAHQSARSKTDEWLTPPEILRTLGDFDLDPCAPTVRPWPTAKLHYCKADDGLQRPWHGRVWLNPPFGREAARWLEKLVQHGNGIALWAARTETAAFHDFVWGSAHAALFLKGRPHFHFVDGKRAPFNSGAPIVLIAYGTRNAMALEDCGLDGHFVWLRVCAQDKSTGQQDAYDQVARDELARRVA